MVQLCSDSIIMLYWSNYVVTALLSFQFWIVELLYISFKLLLLCHNTSTHVIIQTQHLITGISKAVHNLLWTTYNQWSKIFFWSFLPFPLFTECLPCDVSLLYPFLFWIYLVHLALPVLGWIVKSWILSYWFLR